MNLDKFYILDRENLFFINEVVGLINTIIKTIFYKYSL